MTKKEHEKLQLFCNQIIILEDERDETFKDLQQYCKNLNIPVTCCAFSNYENIINFFNENTEYKKTIQRDYKLLATQKIQRYNELLGEISAIRELMSHLSKLGFWEMK